MDTLHISKCMMAHLSLTDLIFCKYVSYVRYVDIISYVPTKTDTI